MQVSEIWRFPVKSMQGERIDETPVGPLGIEGDRSWALFDAATGLHLTGRRDPDLLFAAARLAGDRADDGVVITLPDGTETDDDGALSAWLGRPVELRRAGATSVGTYEIQLDETDDASWFQWSGPEGSFHDSTKSRVSLISVTALGDWDRRRFRTNVILDAPGDVDLVGRQVTAGSVRLDVTKRIDRCVMVTRPQPPLGDRPALDRDLEVLTTINDEHERCLAIGALVAQPGRIAVGDPVAPAD